VILEFVSCVGTAFKLNVVRTAPVSTSNIEILNSRFACLS